MVTITEVVMKTLFVFLLCVVIIPLFMNFLYEMTKKINPEIMTTKRRKTIAIILTLFSIASIPLLTVGECNHMISEHKKSFHEMKTDTIITYYEYYSQYTAIVNRSNVPIRFYHESSFDGNHASYNFIDVLPSKEEKMDNYSVDNIISKSPLEDNFKGTKVVEDISGLHIWNKGNDTIIAIDKDDEEISRALPSMFSEWKRNISHSHHESND